MAVINKIDLSIAPLIKEEAKRWTVVVNMEGYKSWKLRLWLGSVLIRLACFVVGFNYEQDRDFIDLRKAEIKKK